MSAKVKKHRRGVNRLRVHIILFAVTGIICLIMGVFGCISLNALVKKAALPTKISALQTGAEEQLKTLFGNALNNDKELRNIINGFSGKRKAMKKAVEEGINQNSDEGEIVLSALDTLCDSGLKRVSDEDTKSALLALYNENKNDLKQNVIDNANASVSGITARSVQNDLNVNSTKNYALMYYRLAFLGAGIVFTLAALLLLLCYIKKDEERRAKIGLLLEPFDYLAPFMIGVIIFSVYPMVRVALMSFQENYRLGRNAVGEFTGWGLGNFRFVLNGVKGTPNIFLRGLKNTAEYVIITVPITVVLALVFANLLNRDIKAKGLFQTAYFLPMVTTATAVGLVWRWMFSEKFGLINAFLSTMGIEKIKWIMTSDHIISMSALSIFGVWNTLPFTIILLLSGLQNIDDHLYTVARVDGSGSMRIFFKITVPLLSPTIGLVMIINSISAFKVYTEVMVLWNGKPNDFGMETVAWYIYNNISVSDGTHSLGFAAAAAIVLFIIIFIFTMAQKYIQRKWVYE